MNLIIAAGLCALIPPVYFIRLLADAKKLQRRLREWPREINKDVQEEEVLLIKLDCAMWTAPPFCEFEALGSGGNATFDQVVERPTEEPCFIASKSLASTTGRRRVS